MRRFRWAALPVFFGIFYLVPLDFRALWMPDELRYAEISREMLATGHWIVPHLLGLRYFEKPVLGYWMNNISQLIFGHDNFAVRFAPALATAVSAWLVYWLALRFWRSRRRAFASALVYLSMFLVYGVGTYSVLDAMFTLWMTAAMVAFCFALEAPNARRRVLAYAVFGLACGGGFLTKGFIAWAIPFIAIAGYMLYRRRLAELLMFGPVAVLAAALICVPWGLAIQGKEPGFWHYFFWVEHIQRFAGQDAQHGSPVWFYLPVLLLGCMPWLGLVPGAWRGAWRSRAKHPEFIYILCWLILPFLFFSAARGKLVTYILPCFAPMALLLGSWIITEVESGNRGALRVNGAINVVFGIIGIGLLVWLSRPEQGIYGSVDGPALALGFISFAAWVLFGLVQWRRPLRRWAAAALCPVVLGLLLAWALPQSVVNSKQPGRFVEHHKRLLGDAGALVANDPGLAYALAWKLQRADINLYRSRGELDYGLGYPDVRESRELTKREFPGWLSHARRKGPVAVFLRYHSDRENLKKALQPFPAGYEHIARNDLILLIYPKVSS